MSHPPTEYFGPHARRWTDPDTGLTLSLNPRDYARAVDRWAQLQEERREEELRAEAVSAEWDDKALELHSTTFETMDVEKTTAGELIVDGGFRTPEHQRYEFEVEPSPVTISPEMAARYDAIVYGATRGGIKYQPMPVRFLSLVEDDTFGSIIRPVEQSAPGRPAARHFRRRRSTRNLVRLGLVYIIAIIGVVAVAVEVL